MNFISISNELTESATTELFEKFFREFVDIESNEPKYMNQIQGLPHKTGDRKTVYISHVDLPEELADLFFRTTKFEYYIHCAKEAVESIFMELFPALDKDEALEGFNVRLVIDDPLLVQPIRSVNIKKMNRVVLFDATITSTSEVKSALKDRKYRCQSDKCNSLYSKPTKVCAACKGKDTIKFSLFDSKFTEYQLLELQERQDDRTTENSAALPLRLEAKVYGSLVNTFRAGDNVRITGFVKLARNISDKSINADIDSDFSTDILFDLIVEIHNIQFLSTSTDAILADPKQILSNEDIAKIRDFRRKFKDNEDGDAKLLEVLCNSFAPYIFGYQTEKSVILHQLVGSIVVELNEFTSKRPDIHVLFIGDPGTTKTSMLQEAAKMSIHGIYTSGKGSSGVGLTASVDSKDGKGINRLKVGAAVIADKGLCAVDELLHISEDDRSYLLECMESGSFSVNKGGIHAKLNTRTSFLMATNSENGKYNPYATLKENVPMQDQLWSRFDFVGVMRDIANTKLDSKIADHLISLYDPSYNPQSIQEDKNRQKVLRDFLFKYLVYAKTNNTKDIRFTPDAIALIKSFYNEIRQPEKETDVTATPRQLEGIIRFCIARARIMLRNVVREYDAAAIIDILTRGFESCGMMIKGSSTGLNMTAEYSKPLNKLSPPLAFKEVMLRLTKNNTEEVEKAAVIVELVKKAGWEIYMAEDFFAKMYEVKNEVMQTKPGWYKLVNNPTKINQD